MELLKGQYSECILKVEPTGYDGLDMGGGGGEKGVKD